MNLNGVFARWGKTQDEDPTHCNIGAEILDLEISSGKCMGNCTECYKENSKTKSNENMSFDDFVKVFHKVANTKIKQLDNGKLVFKNDSPLTQIAFGICDIGSNPDFFKMMEYSKSFGITPNYTCHGLDMTKEYAEKTAKTCGAVAVSVYNKTASYNAVKMLSDAGMKQTNFQKSSQEECKDE